MSDWQPMATAPKDGREIIAKGEGGCAVVRWHFGILGHGWFNDARMYIRFTPDRWHELPEDDE